MPYSYQFSKHHQITKLDQNYCLLLCQFQHPRNISVNLRYIDHHLYQKKTFSHSFRYGWDIVSGFFGLLTTIIVITHKETTVHVFRQDLIMLIEAVFKFMIKRMQVENRERVIIYI